ncbi:hypothetical protein [Streptomyces sp. NPDC002521]
MRVRKISALTLAALAVGLSLTACSNGGTDSTSSSSASSSASTSPGQSGTRSGVKTSHGSAHAKPAGTPKKPGVSCTNQIDYAGDSRSNAEINTIGERTGYCPPVSTSAGGGANAGNHGTVVGTLKYLAPGKLIVKPQGGGTDQAFLVSNATQILGAAAICSDTDGRVTIGGDGYGTSKCTVDQLEKAAKTDSVTVRVTMNAQSGGAETVAEKYHP